MGVDLNSFIRDPSFSPKKITLAKLLPSCVLSFAEVCCIYVCHVCCALLTKLHCLSACVFYLTVDTLYASFVSPGIARITVAAGHSNLLIMGWGSDVAG